METDALDGIRGVLVALLIEAIAILIVVIAWRVI
jgi:hypothetical protein